MNVSHLKNMLVFEGSDAVLGYLHPDTPQPLLELPESLNPFHKDQVRIFAKLFTNTWNSKAVAAFGMLEDALESGALKGKHTLVEASSGNMVLWLCIFTQAFRKRYGIRTVVPVLPLDVARSKVDILMLHSVRQTISSMHGSEGIDMAKDLAAKNDGWVNLNQYVNEANPRAHERWTGPQIVEQIEHIGCTPTIFCAGLGTTGTLIGVSRFLRNRFGKENITMVGVICEEDSAVPGVRSLKKLEQISLDWKPCADHMEFVRDRGPNGAYATSLRMFTQGIPGGPSSGFALRGLINFLGKEKDAKRLDKYRNKAGEIVAAFVCPDGHNPYLDKYSTQLEANEITW